MKVSRTEAAMAIEAVALRGLAKLWLARHSVDEWLVHADARVVGCRPGTLEQIDAVTDPVLRRWWPTRTTCLPRAIARYVMARRRGIDVTFVMGVCEVGNEFRAHAWLEHDGVPVFEREATDYAVTWRHPQEP